MQSTQKIVTITGIEDLNLVPKLRVLGSRKTHKEKQLNELFVTWKATEQRWT